MQPPLASAFLRGRRQFFLRSIFCLFKNLRVRFRIDWSTSYIYDGVRCLSSQTYVFFRLLREKKKQDELLDQIDALKQKVASANEGLAAANRLSEQLEKKTQAIAMLKHEVKLREDLLKKAQSQLKDVQSNNTVKVDRYRGGN